MKVLVLICLLVAATLTESQITEGLQNSNPPVYARIHFKISPDQDQATYDDILPKFGAEDEILTPKKQHHHHQQESLLGRLGNLGKRVFQSLEDAVEPITQDNQRVDSKRNSPSKVSTSKNSIPQKIIPNLVTPDAFISSGSEEFQGFDLNNGLQKAMDVMSVFAPGVSNYISNIFEKIF